MRRKKSIIFLVYLIFGAYLINLSINFIKIPEFISGLNEIIFLILGVLIVLAGVVSLRSHRRFI